MFNLDGKIALVTGATGGLGSAIARSLYKAGATVVLSGRRLEILNDLAKELGERAHVAVADLGDKDSVQSLVGKVTEEVGAISILVNNAGLTRDNLFMRMKDQELDEVIDVNLKAPFYLSRAVMRGMMKARWGRIINISSIVAVTGNPGQANYCASKAGIIGLSKSLAHEIASRNITVNCVAPGFIESDMTSVLPDAQKEALLSGIPQGRMGKPEDIANAVLYLASEEAGYITGQTLHVNGGMAMI
tara:strand:- start:4328 stop:5065 length:738 start_codon:yes stop_codon:yes gene_type:complete